jgi:deoxyribodipyrimidine photolyase-related protein
MTSATGRRHVLVLGDQLSRTTGPLATADPSATTVLLVISTAWGRRRRCHRQKLVLVYSAMHHFAAELRAAGFDVRERRVDAFEEGLAAHMQEFPGAGLEMMEPADHGVGDRLAARVTELGGRLDRRRNGLWLSDESDFDAWADGRRSLRMEHWYRRERRRTGWLMVAPPTAGTGMRPERGAAGADAAARGPYPATPGDPAALPEGGTWNLDAENRRRVPAGLRFRPPLSFPPDAITREVMAWVERTFPDHPGTTSGFAWPVTHDDARRALEDFVHHRLVDFGPYQDALVDGQRTLAHSLLSAPLNVGLLSAGEACQAVLAAYHDPVRRADAERRVPLSSAEGFIRQLLGWREFLRHVYRRRMPGLAEANGLSHAGDLPDFYWTGRTNMRCLGDAVHGVLATGHAHHIQRLMVLGDWALLAGVDPRQVNGWFLDLFVDACDWVVTPNVMGMSQFADGSFTSKPYIGGGAYIDRMGDHCAHCVYDPRLSSGGQACPFTTLYWDFVDRHADLLAGNARTGNIVRAWRRRPESGRTAILKRADDVRRMAAEGQL